MVIRETLELADWLQGIMSLLFVCIAIIVCSKIITRYFKYKKIEFLLIGGAWIGMAVPWVPDSINLIMLVASDSVLPDDLYLIIGNSLLPLFILLWLIGFSKLLAVTPKNLKLILIIWIIVGILYELLFFSFLSSNLKLVGIYKGPFHYEFGDIITIFFIVFIVIVLITGILFAKESLKSDNQEIKLKGKLILSAFLLFTVGALLDSSISLIPFTVVLTRGILILSIITFYLGFILPDWAKKFLLKEK
jgi:hypothetical protein